MLIYNRINTRLINTYLEDNELSKETFCNNCNIDIKAFDKIMDSDFDFNIKELLKISNYISKTLNELIISDDYRTLRICT